MKGAFPFMERRSSQFLEQILNWKSSTDMTQTKFFNHTLGPLNITNIGVQPLSISTY